MDGGFKAYVRLGDVRPSEANPRKDFGDIDALARSLEATGGEPVNPIVLVRDGNVYRIVDGERRYRALCKIHDEDERVGALVFNDYGDASALVAMLATDDKMRLAPEEQAVGFQQMMVLDVDEDVAAKALGRDVDQVRRARRSLKAASAVEQSKFDLDTLIIAGDEEFTDEERETIISAGKVKGGWGTPESAAADIRRQHKAMQKLDSLKRDGIVYHDEVLYEPAGWVSVATCRNAKEADAVDVGTEGTLHAWWNQKFPAPSGWSIYRKMTEDELDQAQSVKDEQKKETLEHERQMNLCRLADEEMMGWLLDSIMPETDLMAELPATCAAVIGSRKEISPDRYGMDEIMVAREGDVVGSAPSLYEVVAWLDRSSINVKSWYSTPFYTSTLSWDKSEKVLARAWDALVADGWEPMESILEVREACGKVEE